MARVTEVPNNVHFELDKGIWGNAQHENRGVEIAPGFLHHGLRSHVLLAACGAKELARERPGVMHEAHSNGLFTAALLKTLGTVGAQNITYTNLLMRLPSLTDGQNS